MRIRWLAVLLALSLCIPALAQGQIIPDERIHQAITTMFTDDPEGECWTEGHILLGEADCGDTVEVYAYISIANYGFLGGAFTNTGCGAIMPVVIVFDKAEGYPLREIIEPGDGTDYRPSIQRMFPAGCLLKMDLGFVKPEHLLAQQHAMAQAYLNAIGRTEPVMQRRELSLYLADMLTEASNLVLDFAGPYPLEVTTRELVEDGVRCVYRRTWMPDADAVPSPDGLTGTQVLTKSRYDDGAVVETITIRAATDRLTVAMADQGGTRTYTFAWDGDEYHRPVIEETGHCGVYYEMFDIHCGQLPL